MKLAPLSILTTAVLMMLPGLAHSQIITVQSNLGNLSTMPGSATDFTLFGDQSQFPALPSYGGAEGQPTVLNDFSVVTGVNAQHMYGGNGNYSVINAPVGSGDTSVTTGIVFSNGSSAPDLVDFTLGTPGSRFNFASFNVYVMYGNAHDGYEINTSIDAKLLSPSSVVLSSVAPAVIDSNSATNGDYSKATYEEFTVTGASAGDILQLGAGGWGYLGGVSFQANAEVPEPSTYALMLGGLAFLAFCARRKAALVK